MTSALDYYATPGELTELSDFKSFTDWLSPDPRVIFQVVQGLLVHDMWIERYGLKPQPGQTRKVCSPSAKDLLEHAQSLHPDLSLSMPRNPKEKVVICCREFTLLAVALFRAKGVPARARCGFAMYLAEENYYEDHWVCEYWNGKSWVSIDPQIDPFQQSTFYSYATTQQGIGEDYKNMLLSFDPMNVSEKHFVNAGKAWKLYRDQQVEPSRFGISSDPQEYGLQSLYGAWFIRGQLLRDFAALNKIETVPFLVRLEFGEIWDEWRLVAAKDDELQEEDYELLDKIAEFCADQEKSMGISKLGQIYMEYQDLHPNI